MRKPLPKAKSLREKLQSEKGGEGGKPPKKKLNSKKGDIKKVIKK